MQTSFYQDRLYYLCPHGIQFPNLRGLVYTQYGRNAFRCQGNSCVHAHTVSEYLKNFHTGNHSDVLSRDVLQTITIQKPKAWLTVINSNKFRDISKLYRIIIIIIIIISYLKITVQTIPT
jgi:hypothetical protein